MCFDIFYKVCLKLFSFYEEFSEVVSCKNIGLHVKYPLFLSDFNQNLNFIDRFSKNNQISNFINFRPVGAELFHADGRTDMTRPMVTLRNYANAPKTGYCIEAERSINLLVAQSHTKSTKYLSIVTTASH